MPHTKRTAGLALSENPLLLKLGDWANTYKKHFLTGVFFVLIVALFFCLLSYHPADPAWSHFSSESAGQTSNILGHFGAMIADLLYTFFGSLAWLLLVWLFAEMYLSTKQTPYILPMRLMAYALLQNLLAVLLYWAASKWGSQPMQLAGVIGYVCYDALSDLLGESLALSFTGIMTAVIAAIFFLPTVNFPKKIRRSHATQNTAPQSSTINAAPQNAAIQSSAIHTPPAKVSNDVSAMQSRAAQNPPQHLAPQTPIPQNVLQQFLQESGLAAQTDELPPIKYMTLEQPTHNPHSRSAAMPLQQNNNQNQTQHAPPSVSLAAFSAAAFDVPKPANNEHSPAAAPMAGHNSEGVANPPATSPAPSDATPTPAQSAPSKPDPSDDIYRQRSLAMDTARYQATLSPLPGLELLDAKHIQPFGYSHQELMQLADQLAIKLQEFNISGSVQHIMQGPIVTSFEVELAAGVRASRVTGIASDLARSLALKSLRVVEVIPGKPYIGIEIPNKAKETVKLIELLTAPPDGTARLLQIAIGKDIAGQPIIADLAKAPHMLVAGTTGSGKSVFVNALILSMLLTYTPEELRLVMIDPKILEFGLYADIPHLITPVVTDMESEALPALGWCVAEMERRYQLMNFFKVRKIDEFNKKLHDSTELGKPLFDPLWQAGDSVSQSAPPKLKPLPFIVIIVDEYADLVKQLGKPVEDLVVRLAQKARAAGIHIIIATQRPSVDVITGLIKSNIPSRVAMMLKTKVDSRTVIDTGGAETLLGDGDMLFIAPGSNDIIRAHAPFVSDGEVLRITEAWRERGFPDYVELSSGAGDYLASNGDDDSDPLYQDALAFVVDSGKTSISAIQRKLSIGYNRAANIVDDMQARGVLSSPDQSGKRTLLL